MANQRLGLSHIDDTLFTPAQHLGTPAFARFDDAAVDSVDEDDAGILRMSANRNLYVNLRDAGGAERGLAISLENAAAIAGDVAHDSPDLGAPVKIGFKGVEYNADPPTISTDNDRSDGICNPQGMQYVVSGHPNSIHREYMTTALQTNDVIIANPAAGSQIVVLNAKVLVSNATTVNPQVRIGFGATVVPTEPASGASVDGMVISHGGIAPGSGEIDQATKVGDDGAGLKITNTVPTGGKITVLVDYFVSTL